MLTGEPPFVGDVAIALINAQLSMPPPPISARRPGLPSAVDLVLAKALAKSPEQRYPTCSDFADDLGKALGLAAGTASVVSDPQATTSSDGGAQPNVPTPTEITNPELMAAALMPEATTGPGQYQPEAVQLQPQAVQYQPQAVQYQPQAVQYQPQAAQYQPQAVQYQPQAVQYQPQVGYGPASPMPPSPPPWVTPVPISPPPKQRGQAALIAMLVVVIVAVLAAGGAVTYALTRPAPTPSPSIAVTSPAPGPSPTPIPTPTPTPVPGQTEAAEVMAINGLLTNSRISRTALSNAANDVGSCLNVENDVTQINQILSERESQLSDAQSLQVDAIPNGSQVQNSLVTALMASVTADQDYLSWAQQQNEDNCTEGTTSQYYQQALADDQTATDDKNAFAGLWEPLANQYGYNPTPYF
jgi:serine/threonine protein kinase